MKIRYVLLGLFSAYVLACGDSGGLRPDASIESMIYVLSNSSPHITEIDGQTNEVTRTADLTVFGGSSDFKLSHFDGINHLQDGRWLWVGAVNCEPDGCAPGKPTGQSAMAKIDLDELEVTAEVQTGDEGWNVYIGTSTQDGRLFGAKHANRALVEVDMANGTLLDTIPDAEKPTADFPDARTCDIDVRIGPDGVERIYYVTRGGDSTVAVDATTKQILATHDHGAGSWPHMVDVAPDLRVWVPERKTNEIAILDPVTLDEVGRVVGMPDTPVMTSWSPDGKTAYVTGVAGTQLAVIDNETYEILRLVSIGMNAQRSAPHPNGERVYVTQSKDKQLAVMRTSDHAVTHIDLDSPPLGVVARQINP